MNSQHEAQLRRILERRRRRLSFACSGVNHFQLYEGKRFESYPECLTVSEGTPLHAHTAGTVTPSAYPYSSISDEELNVKKPLKVANASAVMGRGGDDVHNTSSPGHIRKVVECSPVTNNGGSQYDACCTSPFTSCHPPPTTVPKLTYAPPEEHFSLLWRHGINQSAPEVLPSDTLLQLGGKPPVMSHGCPDILSKFLCPEHGASATCLHSCSCSKGGDVPWSQAQRQHQHRMEKSFPTPSRECGESGPEAKCTGKAPLSVSATPPPLPLEALIPPIDKCNPLAYTSVSRCARSANEPKASAPDMELGIGAGLSCLMMGEWFYKSSRRDSFASPRWVWVDVQSQLLLWAHWETYDIGFARSIRLEKVFRITLQTLQNTRLGFRDDSFNASDLCYVILIETKNRALCLATETQAKAETWYVAFQKLLPLLYPGEHDTGGPAAS
ncbi:putative Meiotic cell cortex C terminal pleckstrin like [Trypanosoma vivax]|uniref:Pleckstrin homology domain-containing protein n=1 Tax=Trypanosoma vivax (strain Y486) TaxID=1055687 RepID=G0TS24_TRYVY|nr:hypothetical protein TRVL_04060 [Trypanosoma vivax]KAH8617398.1 putative Meiotic cell cortex C terminal pleckstrin like [Trypanosoma vivax]CCC46748.1 conserved hypothetical protein [Trypanosoma vivax Y486]